MKITSSTFSKYTLTDVEALTGRILNDMQLGVLHNMRTDIAEQKINLKFTPNDVGTFAQDEAFLKGQLDLLTHLIDSSATAQVELVTPKTPAV